jgi:hypothetical protein
MGNYIVMGKKTKFVIIKNTLTKGMKKYFKLTDPGGKADMEAKKAMGLQLLNNVINGSPRSGVVPPVLTGRLRASGSVFVGNTFVGDSSNETVTEGKPTPNKQHSDNINIVTIGFNTPYAARWHEQSFVPGPFSLQSGDVGNKYLEQHLKADRKELLKLYADIFKKVSGG